VRWAVARSSIASTGCGLDDFELCPPVGFVRAVELCLAGLSLGSGPRECGRGGVAPRSSQTLVRCRYSLLPAPRGRGTKTQPDKWDLLVRTDEKRGRSGPCLLGRDYKSTVCGVFLQNLCSWSNRLTVVDVRTKQINSLVYLL
jgi:hypothetical protein